MKRYIAAQPSTVYSHLSETLNGLSTIRSFNKIEEFEDHMKLKFENNNRSLWLMGESEQFLKLKIDKKKFDT